MRKLLYLLPFPPHLDAAHGGSRAMAQILIHVATRHRVALLYFRSAEDPPIDERLREKCEFIQEVEHPLFATTFLGRWQLRLRIIRGWMHSRPILATTWAVAAYEEGLSALLQTWQPDIIQVEYHIMGQYLSALKQCPAPRVLTEYEPGVQASLDLKRTARGFAWLLHSLDRLAWERFERFVLRNVDAVVVFTERDQKAIARLGQPTPIVRIPLHTVVPQEPLNPLGESPWRLLFLGNFIHPPNVDAALRLVKDIFPGVQGLVPEARLDIVGDHPPAKLRQAANPQVDVTGYVPDVVPYLDRAAVVVVPVRMGGGMRVKVLEAVAAGKAIVASPLAIEGLDLVDGEHILLAESDDQFCERIAQLLIDSAQRTRIAANARAWACTRFNWAESIAAYEKLHADLCHDTIEQTLPGA